MSNQDYLLGVNQAEFDRLQFQHEVWRTNTNAFFDRLGVSTGWNCLDVGAGPGFVTYDIRERVGESGTVTALEPSSLFLNWLSEQKSIKHWNNVIIMNSSVEDADLISEHYDLIFARWVIAFVPQPELFLARLLSALKPGGIIAIQDYYYEGLSLFPKGGAFDGMPDIVKAYYKTSGGDPYITGKLPVWFRHSGLKIIDYSPHTYAGGPESPILEWAHRFFSMHIPHMIEKNVLSHSMGEAMLADWMDHKKNPDTIFFSPIVVDVAAKK